MRAERTGPPGVALVQPRTHPPSSAGVTRHGHAREYYEPRYRSRRLPPGLQKKYARTGHLPPGWQRKMQSLPWYVERRLGVLPRDYRRGVIDDHAVIYVPRSGVIIDATVLF